MTQPTPIVQYHFTTSGGLELDCWLDYDPGERATYDDSGMEPYAELLQAFVGDIDIKEVMDKFWIDHIERECVNNIGEK